MKLIKRRKSSRHRGTRLCGWAAKKHKGKGNRGGKGMSGSNDQKKTYVLSKMWPYFGRAAERKRKEKKKAYNEINLKEIIEKIEGLKKEGLAKEGKEGTEIELKGYKVLGDGEIQKKLIIRALAFTKPAKEKIEKAGGKAIIETGEKKEGEIKQEKKSGKEKTAKAGKTPEKKKAK